MSSLGDSKEQVSKDEWVVWPSSVERSHCPVCVRLGPKNGEIWQESLYLHGSKALHHSELSLCQKGKKGSTLTSQQCCKDVSWACVLQHRSPSASWRDKLNVSSSLLFWCSCWTANLDSFLPKSSTFLSHKHLSHPLCALSSPQLCLFFYRGGVTW